MDYNIIWDKSWVIPLFNSMLLLLNHLRRVWLFATPWTVARPAPLSTGFSTRILEWVAGPSSRGSTWPRGLPASLTSALAGWFFTASATWETLSTPHLLLIFVSLKAFNTYLLIKSISESFPTGLITIFPQFWIFT